MERDGTLSPDSTDDENRAYLKETHILPGMDTMAESETTRGSNVGTARLAPPHRLIGEETKKQRL